MKEGKEGGRREDCSAVLNYSSLCKAPPKDMASSEKETKRCLLTSLKLALDPHTHPSKISAWLTQSLICELTSSNVH